LTASIENDIHFHLVKEVPRSPDRCSDERCPCGSLLARLRSSGVELKCRRCKRVVVIPWSTATTWHGVAVEWQGTTPPGV